jgi:HCOMODA/2-hydroxy-3-carboxy-muconic semialdehyde decarboxylase
MRRAGRPAVAPSYSRSFSVPDPLAELRYELALANRILANEGVLDAFGHVSVRHPKDPDRYLLSRSRAPELVAPGDILEYTLDSQLVHKSDIPLYSERVIHGEIFKARPDVMAVAHHHAPPFMPFVITGTDYVPVFHLGATGGAKPPFWDQRGEFGDTNLLVVRPEEGASLARAMGKHWMVLMNRHGVTLGGTSIRDVVFRAIFSCRNAEFLLRAKALGEIGPLSPGEVAKAAVISTMTTGQSRAWELWTVRLDKAGGTPPRGGAKAKSKSKLKKAKKKR